MFKYISLIIISALLLSSCWDTNNKDKKETPKDTIKIEGIWMTNKKDDNKQKIVFNEEEWKLYIWDKVEISKWLPTGFPEEIEIFWNNESHLNSNVDDYIFFVDNTSEWISDISEFYIDLFKEAWYTKVENDIDDNVIINETTTDEEQEKTIDNLEFVLLNEAYSEPKEWDLPSEELQYKQRILINIFDNTPENIEKWMWLTWNFVEIYYNQIWF